MEEPEMSEKKFGALVRREREAKELRLREMAKVIGVSPTYLSKVERDEFPPPAEDCVKEIAKVIGYDADELLALAGRVASDISDIIKASRSNWRLCCGPPKVSRLRTLRGRPARRRGRWTSKNVTMADLPMQMRIADR
jgi:hypothetical protein